MNLVTHIPLQLLGHISQAVSPLGSSAGYASALESSSSLLLPTSGRLGLLPGAWGAPNKGLKIFLAMLDTCGLWPATGPTLKWPCTTFVQCWDGWWIPEFRKGRFPLQLSSPVVGSHLVGRFSSRRFCWVCLDTGEFLLPQVGPSLAGGGVIAWLLRCP